MLRLTLMLTLIFLVACSPKNVPVADSKKNTVQIDSSAFAAQVGIVAYTSLSKASQAAQTLDNKLASFMHHPNPMSQDEIKQAWRAAYDSYLHSLVFAYLPIQDPIDWRSQHIGYSDLLNRLDSWPIEGGYIDYVQGYPFSGIVNDLTLKIDEASIRSQHGFTDPTNASLGYHALEFMFWGHNSLRSPLDFFPQKNTAPVPINDAADTATVITSDVSLQPASADIKPQNHNRRRQYTLLVSEILQKDLQRILRRWEPSSGYYSQLLQQGSTEVILQSALIATQNLIREEILDKRFQLLSSDFSGSSTQDIIALLNGIEHWFMPTNKDQQQASLLFLLQQTDSQLADEFIVSLNQLKSCLIATAPAVNKLDQCKQNTLQLLTIIHRSADALSVNLTPVN